MNKIRQYINTLSLTKGFFFALLGSLFIYLHYYHFSLPFIESFLALSSLYFLLASNQKVWFWYGFFMAIFWFWWISLSFIHYQMPWAIPLVVLGIATIYGLLFWFIAKIAHCITSYFQSTRSHIFSLVIKALGLLLFSYIHPFGFDWFKPELMFVTSYFGIEKWHFAFILTAILLTLWKKNPLFLLLILCTYQTPHTLTNTLPKNISLVSTHTNVKEKWNTALHASQFQGLLNLIDKAIVEKKHMIILPESVFPVFINHSQTLLTKLQERAKKITIITGGLYWDGKTPRNSTYIFNNNKITIANKVILVPFGEANPLPNFLSHWINKVFYDGAVDYKASKAVSDYTIAHTTYRNAICFEATSERLYEKDKNGKRPKHMIVLSNNGWFTPSIEPTLQKLLLLYYHKKYGTTIYHAVNMSKSYTIP